ncbi:diacylglycerol kinase family lipid kinase [Cutibacterium equinum]|uniref:Diacylglycerol kinase family lipid kinase n=1 Tax=Cutibacterium equinum TaxID=3016342 RepID=A0ABY7QVQ9_9ACTN|nr:diacylglycerol kinase family protein [Cutibacterium equinum]WCC79151.1 diacylglycerol kinase family lipid kinase [Cutibacterium equinum]
MTTRLLVNPAAGGGRAHRLEPWVTARLRSAFGDVDVVRTTSFQHAEQALAELAACDGEGDRVVVMGGDGMVHLGLNHLAGTRIRLGIVPSGTGNDFASSVGLPSRVDEAIKRIVADQVTPIDLAEVTGNVYGGHCWVGCVVSTGYDAIVNRRTNHMTTKFGPLSYGWVALSALADFSPKHYRISVDGQYRELDAMLIAIGNGGHFGGGMRVCPTASVVDGLLDITIIHAVSRRTLLGYLPLLYAGKLSRMDFVETLRAQRVDVDGDDMFAMADGEEIGDVPLTVVARPGAVNLVGLA